MIPLKADIGRGSIALSLFTLSLLNIACPSAGRAKEQDQAQEQKQEPIPLDEQFVQIPAGYLPDGTRIEQFYTAKYPVTRGYWKKLMGNLPMNVPDDCPDCPIIRVNLKNADGSPAEVQEFLALLNTQEARNECTYDLPTDNQLQYMIRADVTGSNTDPYSTGVTDANVDQYITHWGNSDGQIQRVGQTGKTPNAFGIELGNVWRMSKDLYQPTPAYGQSIRGGSWRMNVSYAQSNVRSYAGSGGRHGDVGISLVKNCTD